MRLLERRKSEKPGTCRTASSTRKAGVAARSTLESRMVLPGESERRIPVRVAETMTWSMETAGLRVSTERSAIAPTNMTLRSIWKPSAVTSSVAGLAGRQQTRRSLYRQFWSTLEMCPLPNVLSHQRSQLRKSPGPHPSRCWSLRQLGQGKAPTRKTRCRLVT